MGRSLNRQFENVLNIASYLHGYGTESSGRVFAVGGVLGVVNGVGGVILGLFDGVPVKSCND